MPAPEAVTTIPTERRDPHRAAPPAELAGDGGGSQLVTWNPPRSYLAPVIDRMAHAIPPDFVRRCRLDDGSVCPSTPGVGQQAFRRDYVRQELDRIAIHEYRSWLNGDLPYISPKELHLWRLRQMAERIWDWELPDDEVIAVGYNLTPRKATGLISNFYALFGKSFVYPKMLVRLLALVRGSRKSRVVEKDGDIDGRVIPIPSRRYVDMVNILLDDLREISPRTLLFPAKLWRRNRELMWVADHLLEMFDNDEIIVELKARYPIGGE